MAVPKRRHSTARKGKRRKALSLKLPTLVVCSNCGQAKIPHQVCPNCGYYKGKKIAKNKAEDQKK